MSFSFGKQLNAASLSTDNLTASRLTGGSREPQSAPLSNVCPLVPLNPPLDAVVSPWPSSMLPVSNFNVHLQPATRDEFRLSLSPVGDHSTCSNVRQPREEPLPVLSSLSLTASPPPTTQNHYMHSARASATRPNLNANPPQFVPPLITRNQLDQLSAPVSSISITTRGILKDPSLPTSCVLEASSAPSFFKGANQSTSMASFSIDSSLHVNSLSIPLTNSHSAALPATPSFAHHSSASFSVPIIGDHLTGPQAACHPGPPSAVLGSTPASHATPSHLPATSAPIPAYNLSAPSALAPGFGQPSESSGPVPPIAPRTPSIPLPSTLSANSPFPAVAPATPAPFQFAAPIAPAPRPPQIPGLSKSEPEYVTIQPPSDGELHFLIKGRYYKSPRDPIGRGGFSKVPIIQVV